MTSVDQILRVASGINLSLALPFVLASGVRTRLNHLFFLWPTERPLKIFPFFPTETGCQVHYSSLIHNLPC